MRSELDGLVRLFQKDSIVPLTLERQNNRGFTLAELLIVVAIISVLVGVAIPVFTSQLEKAREATDASNIRSVYAEVITAALAEDKSTPLWTGEIWRSENYALEQEKDGWQTEGIGTTIGALGIQDSSPSTNGVFWVTFDPRPAAALNPVVIHFATESSILPLTPQQVTNKLNEHAILTTGEARANGLWTGTKTAVSAVKVFNSNDTNNNFTTTLKTLVGDTFTYQVARGSEVRYLYITTDGAYEKANDVPGRINVVRYTYDYSAGHTSEKTTSLLEIEYGTAGWKKDTGFDDFIATS